MTPDMCISIRKNVYQRVSISITLRNSELITDFTGIFNNCKIQSHVINCLIVSN